MSISKYVYGDDIRKIINGNVYEIGYTTLKVDEKFDGKITDNKIKENNNFVTYYNIYKNNKFYYAIHGSNLSKGELIKKFEETLDYLLKNK